MTGSIGGQVGQNHGSISACHSTVTVSGAQSVAVGGLVGSNGGVGISSSFATGSVTGLWQVGGLVGSNGRSSISSSYASGNVTGTTSVGGLAGVNGSSGTITACYATGTITGDDEVGGLIGENGQYATVQASYAAGPVSGNILVGGLVGNAVSNDSSPEVSFWDINVTGQTGSPVGRGLTTSQMGEIQFFSNANWSLYDWVMVEGAYPRLAWEGLGWDPVPPPPPPPLDGEGTASDPYLIRTVSDLMVLSNSALIIDKHFRLMADLDCSGIAFCPISPFGIFSGTFDGNSHRVMNCTITMPGVTGWGFFDHIGTSGRVMNLILENISVSGVQYAGGLAAINEGTIINCSVDGQVLGTMYTGGLVGLNEAGTITDCHTLCAVTGGVATGGLAGKNGMTPMEDRFGVITLSSSAGTVVSDKGITGGLVGSNSGSIIADSHATGQVTGLSNVGGLVGWNSGEVERCSASGNVAGTDNSYEGFIGGLVGESVQGTVTNSCAMGAVTGYDAVGGLVGRSGSVELGAGIRGCFATGAVSGTSQVGGLVGTGIDIVACYATGPVIGETIVGGLAGRVAHIEASYAVGAVTGNEYVGGLAGEAAGTGWDCFWDMDASGLQDSPVGKGLTSDQMRMVRYYSMANWSAYEWVMEAGMLPRLAWEETGAAPVPAPPPLPFAGQGTPEDPYQISTAEEFAQLSWNVLALDKHFRLTQDINLAGVRLYPIGDATAGMNFTGVFDGAGHRLMHALLSASRIGLNGTYGLFSTIGENGCVRNLNLWDMEVAVVGPDADMGMLAGRSYGLIHNCTVAGKFFANGEAGGLVGENHGQISLCTINVSLQNNYTNEDEIPGCFGGVAGANYGAISRTSATGHILGGAAGGLVGLNAGEITSCRATITVKGYYAGGLAGVNQSRITLSSSVADVTGEDMLQSGAYAGGGVGWQSGGELSSCFVTGQVKSSHIAGGLVGLWEARSGNIGNCYSRSTVYDRDSEDEALVGSTPVLGGLVGRTEGPGYITNCYAAGVVTSIANPLAGGIIAARMSIPTGPLDGESDVVSVGSCYWDRELSGVNSSQGGTGSVTREMTYPYAAGVYLNWDFTQTWAHDPTFQRNGGYPWLPKASEEILPEVSLQGSQLIEAGEGLALEFSRDELGGPLTAYWYRDGVLVQSGPDTEYVFPHAVDGDAGVYHVIVADGEGNYYRSPDFLVRVAPEGSLPAATCIGLLAILLLVVYCARRSLVWVLPETRQ